ncbi:MAG: RsmD family RNA methyltransferase [Bacteroidetes bacterium]|nr:RsmD family RNA methyltransferase [Bacteroidota bacterium]
MRIISGKYKGRVLNPPGNLPVRPTTDFAKTGLFNILESRFDFSELNCLDLFSGTGNISLEFISRGSQSVTAVDLDFGCIQFIKEMGKKLDIKNLNPLRSDCLKYIEETKHFFDIIFADPPFEVAVRDEIHAIVMKRKLLNSDGFLILEHESKQNYQHLSGFNFSRQYGNVTFSFFSNLEQIHQP